MNAQNAFYEALGRVRSDPLVTVSISSGVSDTKLGAAYVEQVSDHKYRISLFRRGVPYNKLLTYLLHEYGHVLDEERYYGCKRQQDYALYEYSDVTKAPSIPLHGKRAILETEFLAEMWIPKLLKKFGLYEDSLESPLRISCFLQILVRKYEFTFGRFIPNVLYKNFASSLVGDPCILDKSICKDPNFDLTVED